MNFYRFSSSEKVIAPSEAENEQQEADDFFSSQSLKFISSSSSPQQQLLTYSLDFLLLAALSNLLRRKTNLLKHYKALKQAWYFDLAVPLTYLFLRGQQKQLDWNRQNSAMAKIWRERSAESEKQQKLLLERMKFWTNSQYWH